jgi:hypothetical protein
MKYKGIEYKVLQTTTAQVWAWSFEPPKSVPVHGTKKGSRRTAGVAAEQAIDKWLSAIAAESEC